MAQKHVPHEGRYRVAVGPYTIRAGGLAQLRNITPWPGQVLVPLTDQPLPARGVMGKSVVPLYLPDFGGVPDDWAERLAQIINLLARGPEVMAFCYAGHGRTGTLLASLIAMLEDVPDPIATVRARHCEHAVEVLAQATAIFALRRQAVPQCYVDEFTKGRQ